MIGAQNRTSTHASLRHRLWGLLVVCASLIGLSTAVGSSVSAAGATGSISGTVRGDGTALAGVLVYVFSDTAPPRTTTTDSSGGFQIDALPVGSWTVCADGNAEFKGACAGQVAGSGTPTNVTVTDGSTATADIDLVRGATLSVTVIDPDSKPVKLAEVVVTVSNDDSGTSTLRATTSDEGIALVGPIEPGSTAWVRVTGLDNTGLAPEWYFNSPTGAGAKPIAITKAEITSLNVKVGQGLTVRGQVAGAGNVPLEGVTVTLSGPDTTQSAVTGANGWYTVTGLVKGGYTVSFQPKAGDPYAAEYYKDQSSPATATKYQVGRLAVQRLDADLVRGSTVSGVVTADGSPVADAEVSAWIAGSTDFPGIVTTARTDASGTYTLAGLGAGNYVVSATPAAGSSFLTTFFGNTPTEATATPVVVVAEQDLTNQDIVLGKPASISGIVTDSKGVPLAGASVGLRADPYFPFFGCEPDNGSTCATTDAAGAYHFDGVQAGAQYLYVKPPDTRLDLVGEFYDNVHGNVEPTALSVKFAENISANVQLDASGILTGTVRDATTNNPVVGATVYAYGGASYLPPVQTDSNGMYRFEGLDAGDFYVVVEPFESWSGANATASLVLGEVKALDFTLGLGAKITGKVVDRAGVGIADACVMFDAFTVEGDNWCQTFTKSDGTYEITGEPAGEYAVCFSHPSFANKCLDNAVSPLTATKVTIEAGSTNEINATLDKGGSAAIQVKNGDEAIELGIVAITDSTATAPSYEIDVDMRELRPDGMMISPHLAPGNYLAWYFDINDSETPLGKVAFTVTDGQRASATIQLAAAPVVPSAPEAPTVNTGDGSATLTWAAPADGGSPITGYVAEYRPVGAAAWTAVTPAPTTPTATVTGLTNGTAYEFRVAAVNTVGQGSFSAATAATPPVIVTTTSSTSTSTTSSTTSTSTTTSTTTPTSTTTTTSSSTSSSTTAAPTTATPTTQPATNQPATTQPPTVVTIVPVSELPATGGGLGLLWPALFVMFAGAVLIVITRRRAA